MYVAIQALIFFRKRERECVCVAGVGSARRLVSLRRALRLLSNLPGESWRRRGCRWSPGTAFSRMFTQDKLVIVFKSSPAPRTWKCGLSNMNIISMSMWLKTCENAMGCIIEGWISNNRRLWVLATSTRFPSLYHSNFLTICD